MKERAACTLDMFKQDEKSDVDKGKVTVIRLGIAAKSKFRLEVE